MFPLVQEPVYSLGELQSMLDGMIQDFAAPQPDPTGFFAEPSGAAERSTSTSARMHPQGIDPACFTRTAFSR
jgi:DnaJ family protein B protein 8